MATSRDRLREIANSNARIVEAGHYQAYDGTHVDIGEALARSRTGTAIVAPGEPGTPRQDACRQTWLTISEETTLDAILRLRAEATDMQINQGRPMAVLNFASATTPGGGYLRGGTAQEESLCRATTLYNSLESQTDFYARNKALGDAIYQDALILSPEVLVIRDRWHNLLPQPIPCTVLTCPAPNRAALIARGADQRKLSQSDAALGRRITLILDTVAAIAADITVLGAWGCGVFGNDPHQVASVFLNGIMTRPHLGQIHFAIPDLKREPVGAAFFQEMDRRSE